MASPPSRIVLVNMPFASPEMPSLALTQLKAVLERRFDTRIAVELLYLNLDLVDFLGGLAAYQLLVSSLGRMTGVADWLFRQAAFPEAVDNADAYLARYYFDEEEEEVRQVRALIAEKRPKLTAFLDGLIEHYRLHEAEVVGFSLLFHQTGPSFALARRIKDRNPAVLTIAGGAACESVMGREYARQVEQIDFVFSGPALVSFPDFLECRLAGDLAGCSGIPGVFSKGNLHPASETGIERDLNALLEPDYGDFLDRSEAAFPDGALKPVLLFETSRGCRWGEKIACSFCGLNGTSMTYRRMSPENVLKVLNGLFRHAPRCSFFLAVDTLVPDDYFESVFPALRPPEGVALMYEVRPTLTADRLRMLHEAGIRVIQPGIESLSTPTLKRMRKGTTSFANIRFLKACSRFPIRVEWNLLLGSPGEGEDVWLKYLRDLPQLAHLHPPGGAFPISFDRFSRYFDEPQSFDLDLQPRDFYAWAFPFDEPAIRNIAYHFVDRNADAERLDTWVSRLNTLIGEWRLRWDNEAQLRLVEDGGEWHVYDSRQGGSCWLPLTPDLRSVLAYLELPRTREQTVSRFGERLAGDALGLLRDSKLVFEEGDRMMSLVVHH